MSDPDVKQKMVVLAIDPQALARLFDLPDGAVIDRVWMPNDEHQGSIRVRVVGIGHDVSEGMRVPMAHGAVTESRDAEGKVVLRSIKWHL